MYWVGWNDKLIANPTHRLAVATVVAAEYAATVRIEVQVPSVVRVRSEEGRTPNVTVVAYMVKK